MAKLISFDPEVESPCCSVFVDGVWRESKKFQGDWPKRVYDFLKEERPGMVLIEDQYVPALPSKIQILQRTRSLFKLVASRAYIECACKLLGIAFECVNPLSWQSVIGGSKQGRDKCKAASLALYKIVTKQCTKDNNISDSFCIGWWWLCKEHQDG